MNLIFKRVLLGLGVVYAFAAFEGKAASAVEGKAEADRKVILTPSVNAKKFSRKHPIVVDLALVREVLPSVFDGESILECTASFFNSPGDRPDMKAKLTRTLVFVDENGLTTEVDLGSKKAKGSFVRFELALPQVDFEELAPNVDAFIHVRLKLLKRKQIRTVIYKCEIEYG